MSHNLELIHLESQHLYAYYLNRIFMSWITFDGVPDIILFSKCKEHQKHIEHFCNILLWHCFCSYYRNLHNKLYFLVAFLVFGQLYKTGCYQHNIVYQYSKTKIVGSKFPPPLFLKATLWTPHINEQSGSEEDSHIL